MEKSHEVGAERSAGTPSEWAWFSIVATPHRQKTDGDRPAVPGTGGVGDGTGD
jgi:hypothetical protein